MDIKFDNLHKNTTVSIKFKTCNILKFNKNTKIEILYI